MTSAAFENIISRDKREQFIGLRNTAFVLLVCLVALYVTGFFDAQRFIEGAPAVKQLSSEMVPPNFDRWEHWVIPLRDTLAMSIAGTALTIVLSLPLALLAAPNTTPNPLVGRVARVILAAFRSVPEIILGILFVAAVGLVLYLGCSHWRCIPREWSQSFTRKPLSTWIRSHLKQLLR
jgi:phosphonate transport system permease protein